MKELKTRKFWFLVLTIGICISFGGLTVFNQFIAPSKIYAENLSEKGQESDEKSTEINTHFYLHEAAFEWSLTIDSRSNRTLVALSSKLPMFWPSLNTPPPDLS